MARYGARRGSIDCIADTGNFDESARDTLLRSESRVLRGDFVTHMLLSEGLPPLYRVMLATDRAAANRHRHGRHCISWYAHRRVPLV